jgi:serine/threonine-protein kinase
LKPDNVFLVDRDDDPLFTKIVDFGISKMMSRRDGETMGTLTRKGMVLGTPYYMSPEQAQAVSDLDGRTDLWSVGAIMYECLAGRMPFQGDAYEPIIVGICTADPPDLRSLAPNVPERLAAVVRQALTRDRSRRFQTAKEMIDALEATGLARSSSHVPAPSGDAAVAAAREARSELSSGRTRVSWTSRAQALHGDDGAPARRAARTGVNSARGLLLLGGGLMVATFLVTFLWLRSSRRAERTAVVDSLETRPATTSSAPAAPSAPMVAKSTEPRDPKPSLSAEARTVNAAVAEPTHHADHATVSIPVKKKQAPPMAAAAPAPSPAAKTGVAGGLQIKTTYP